MDTHRLDLKTDIHALRLSEPRRYLVSTVRLVGHLDQDSTGDRYETMVFPCRPDGGCEWLEVRCVRSGNEQRARMEHAEACTWANARVTQVSRNQDLWSADDECA